MAFVYKQGQGSYLRLRRIQVDSLTDKSTDAQDNRAYIFTANLREELQNVISISITGWNLPKDITPSFWPPNQFIQGNDTLDFSITNKDINGGVPVDFSVQLPNKLLYWAPTAPAETNLANILDKLIYDAIAANPLYVTGGGENIVTVTCSYTFGQNFSITILENSSANWLNDQFFQLSLNFLSGPNTDRACNVQLGFPIKDDYQSYLNPLVIGLRVPQIVISPQSTNLQLFKYVDVFIAESNKKPVARIYLTNPAAFRTAPSNAYHKVTRVDTDNPPKTLKSLRVDIRLPGLQLPRLYQSLDDLETQFTFSILQVAEENNILPTYMSQTLTW